MDVTWVDVVSLVVLVISSGATIWIAIVAASTSRSAAQTAKLALERSEARGSRADRLAVVRHINAWAEKIGEEVVRGTKQGSISAEFAVHLAAADGSDPIVDWYIEQVNVLIAAFPGHGTSAIRDRLPREAHLRAQLATRARDWVGDGDFDDSPIDPLGLIP